MAHDDSLWMRTQHSLLKRASRDAPGPGRDAAWHELVQRYRHPIAVCIRRHVGGHPDRDEIIDGFFTYLFSQRVLARLDLKRGRFRVFLQGVIRLYVLATLRERRARGEAHDLDRLMAPAAAPSEEEEERAWATTLLRNAERELLRLRPRDGRMLLQFYGIPPYTKRDVASLASDAELTPNAVHQSLHRTRRLLRRLLETEIRQLVSSDADYLLERRALIGRLIEARPDLLH